MRIKEFEDPKLTAAYGNSGSTFCYPEIEGKTMEPARTIIVVSAKKAEHGIEREMEPRGVRVLWADSIKAATALLGLAPDGTVVLTELALRDGNWRDLVEGVRRIGKSIPVALVSPASTPELWWDALECGVEDILPAPLSASRICEYLGSS
jgi:DNA-binding NtrC family response regulator